MKKIFIVLVLAFVMTFVTIFIVRNEFGKFNSLASYTIGDVSNFIIVPAVSNADVACSPVFNQFWGWPFSFLKGSNLLPKICDSDLLFNIVGFLLDFFLFSLIIILIGILLKPVIKRLKH